MTWHNDEHRRHHNPIPHSSTAGPAAAVPHSDPAQPQPHLHLHPPPHFHHHHRAAPGPAPSASSRSPPPSGSTSSTQFPAPSRRGPLAAVVVLLCVVGAVALQALASAVSRTGTAPSPPLSDRVVTHGGRAGSHGGDITGSDDAARRARLSAKAARQLFEEVKRQPVVRNRSLILSGKGSLSLPEESSLATATPFLLGLDGGSGPSAASLTEDLVLLVVCDSFKYARTMEAWILNKACFAKARGLGFYLWVGNVVTSSPDTQGRSGGSSSSTNHYNKVFATAYALQFVASTVFYLDVDAYVSKAAFHSPHLSFATYTAMMGPSSHFGVAAWEREHFSSSIFAVRNSSWGRDVLGVWWSMRKGVKDQPLLWHSLFERWAADGRVTYSGSILKAYGSGSFADYIASKDLFVRLLKRARPDVDFLDIQRPTEVFNVTMFPGGTTEVLEKINRREEKQHPARETLPLRGFTNDHKARALLIHSVFSETHVYEPALALCRAV